jgi:hypothetical protein
MKTAAFWDIVPCILIEMSDSFLGDYTLQRPRRQPSSGSRQCLQRTPSSLPCSQSPNTEIYSDPVINPVRNLAPSFNTICSKIGLLHPPPPGSPTWPVLLTLPRPKFCMHFLHLHSLILVGKRYNVLNLRYVIFSILLVESERYILTPI